MCLAQQFPLLDEKGKVQDFLREERQRGIRFDVGHGSGSFWFRQAVPCFEQDFWPDTLSTDLHHQNVTGPAMDLVYVMSKFLGHGHAPGEVLYRVTRAPALVIGRPELGTLRVGGCADLAVLRCREGTFGYLDCGGARLRGEGKLECVATVRAGEVIYDPEARSAPDWPGGARALLDGAGAPAGLGASQGKGGNRMRLNEREDILDLTREWTGERFPNGRPRVSDEKIEIIKTLTQEEIWHPLYFSGYRFQFQGGLRTLHPGKKLYGRAVTCCFAPQRPDVRRTPLAPRRPNTGRATATSGSLTA